MVTATSQQGCVAEAFEVVVNVNANPQVAINPGGSTDLCAGEERLLSGYVLPTTSNYSYEWSIANVDAGNAILTDGMTLNLTLSAPTDGSTTVVLQMKATSVVTGCIDSTDVTFTVTAAPVFAAGDPTGISMCEGGLGSMTSGFDLNDAITGTYAEDITFHVSESDALAGVGVILEPEAYTGSDNEEIYVRIDNGVCEETSQFTLDVIPLTYLIVNTNDSGTGSMRGLLAEECIYDTIYVDESLLGQTINLTSGEVTIPNKVVAIKGLGIDDTSITANSNSRIFNIQAGEYVELIGMSLSESEENIDGGAIINQGELVLENVRLVNNTENNTPKAVTNKPGAIMRIRGTVIIED